MSETGHKHAVATGATAALIDGVRCEAEHAADLLIDRLEAHGLIPPEKQRRRKPVRGLSLVLVLRAAAVLRRLEWTKNGQDEFIQEIPPEPDLAPRLDAIFRTVSSGEAAESRRYALRTLLAWIQNFSWSARAALGVDVVLGGPGSLDDRKLDELAGFLWRNRGGPEERQGDSNGRA